MIGTVEIIGIRIIVIPIIVSITVIITHIAIVIIVTIQSSGWPAVIVGITINIKGNGPAYRRRKTEFATNIAIITTHIKSIG